MTAGQASDYTVAAALLDDLKAQWLLCDRGGNADWFRDALQAKGIQPCIPGQKSRNEPVRYDKRRYRSRSRSRIKIIRAPQGLAPRRHLLRPVPDRLLLRRRPRSHRHLLAAINES